MAMSSRPMCPTVAVRHAVETAARDDLVDPRDPAVIVVLRPPLRIRAHIGDRHDHCRRKINGCQSAGILGDLLRDWWPRRCCWAAGLVALQARRSSTGLPSRSSSCWLAMRLDPDLIKRNLA